MHLTCLRVLSAIVMSLALLIVLVASDAVAKGGGSRGGGYRGGGHSGGGHVGVRPYTRRDGTYVQPHHRTAPNSTQHDNFSSKPNLNPYTVKPGTRDPER